jgi:choline dehydrogenase-like flavoprotein
MPGALRSVRALAPAAPMAVGSAVHGKAHMRRHPVYDYIIVGAGSAGCVLAHRLTENASATVLLLEAGGPDRALTLHMPAAFSTMFKSRCDWAYDTAPQPSLNQRRLYWPRGKVLGGSSAMNAMIYTRGNPSDYNDWQALGNPGWSFADVLPSCALMTLSPPAHGSQVRGCVLRRGDPLLCWGQIALSSC